MTEEDDPVLASYDVYVNQASSISPQEPSKQATNGQIFFLLQYPSHRSASKPYDNSRTQKPLALRVKPETGLVEVDIPIITTENYNSEAGKRYAKALSESRILQAGGTFGLAGGFNTGPRQPIQLRNGYSQYRDDTNGTASDAEGGEQEEMLAMPTQVMGGKIVVPTERDPIYMLGLFEGNQLQLYSLDAILQMRPQLHHIDAEEENTQKRFHATSGPADIKAKSTFETLVPKVESKPVEIKIKDSKDDTKDMHLNENASLLLKIQMDQWREYNWVDQNDIPPQKLFKKSISLRSKVNDGNEVGMSDNVKLKSCISNGDWLDRMSAPREDGKKGLLAKLRGRERERARRKKAEEEKRQKLKERSTASTNIASNNVDMSTDSELSSPDGSESEASEGETRIPDPSLRHLETIDRVDVENVEIKEEPMTSIVATEAPEMAQSFQSVPKKRGRPKRNQNGEVISVED